MARADHIVVKRPDFLWVEGMYHHGVDLGDGTVVHFSGNSRESALINRTNMRAFSAGCEILVCDYNKVKDIKPFKDRSGNLINPQKLECKVDEEVLRVALGNVGTNAGVFHPQTNNCETFATYAKTGVSYSLQFNEFSSDLEGFIPIKGVFRIISEAIRWHASSSIVPPSSDVKPYYGSIYICGNDLFFEIYEEPYSFPPIWYVVKNKVSPLIEIPQKSIPYPLQELHCFDSPVNINQFYGQIIP